MHKRKETPILVCAPACIHFNVFRPMYTSLYMQLEQCLYRNLACHLIGTWHVMQIQFNHAGQSNCSPIIILYMHVCIHHCITLTLHSTVFMNFEALMITCKTK